MVNEFENMPREDIAAAAIKRKLCLLVTRDDKALSHYVSESVLHNFDTTKAHRYHRAATVLIWCPDTKRMVFRQSNDGWSAFHSHVYFEELRLEAARRILIDQAGIVIPPSIFTSRCRKAFTLPPSIGTGMEVVSVYQFTLGSGEPVVSPYTEVIALSPHDMSREITMTNLKATSLLTLTLEHLIRHYIF